MQFLTLCRPVVSLPKGSFLHQQCLHTNALKSKIVSIIEEEKMLESSQETSKLSSDSFMDRMVPQKLDFWKKIV